MKGLPAPVHMWAAAWEPAPKADPVGLPPALGSTDTSMSFAGRTTELGDLFAAWRRATTGTRQIVLLSGEPGIGKTRLAFEIARTAHDEGALALYGRCDEDAAAPYQPFTEVIDWYFTVAGVDVVTGPAPGELARLSQHRRERSRDAARFARFRRRDGPIPSLRRDRIVAEHARRTATCPTGSR